MKKGIAIFLGVLLGFSSLSCYCQSEKGRELLQEVKNKFDAIQDFSADMMYEIGNPSGNQVKISKNGKFLFAEGKYRFQADDLEIYSDGQTLWIHQFADSPANEELEITAVDSAEDQGLFLLFFIMSDPNWTPEYLGEKKLADTSYEKVSLSSGNANLDFIRMNLWINASTYFPEKVVALDRGLTRISCEFSNILLNQDLPESTFRFDTSNFQGRIYDDR
ncbi:outer membrane lipoprotein carrier protein LolA [Cyclobacterium xiamenense]|uniref:LolA family protein n=1 Tax=Cyclobacterium xiamenense TaxID=1297121 RepID=UPI0035CF9BE7